MYSEAQKSYPLGPKIPHTKGNALLHPSNVDSTTLRIPEFTISTQFSKILQVIYVVSCLKPFMGNFVLDHKTLQFTGEPLRKITSKDPLDSCMERYYSDNCSQNKLNDNLASYRSWTIGKVRHCFWRLNTASNCILLSRVMRTHIQNWIMPTL